MVLEGVPLGVPLGLAPLPRLGPQREMFTSHHETLKGCYKSHHESCRALAHPDGQGPSYGGVGPESFGGVWGLKPLGFEGPRAVNGASGSVLLCYKAILCGDEVHALGPRILRV